MQEFKFEMTWWPNGVLCNTRDGSSPGSVFSVMSMKRSTHVSDFHVSQKFWQKCCFPNKMVQDHKIKDSYFQDKDKTVEKPQRYVFP